MAKFTVLICLILLAYGKSSPIEISDDAVSLSNYEKIGSFLIAVQAGNKKALNTYDNRLTNQQRQSVRRTGEYLEYISLAAPKFVDLQVRDTDEYGQKFNEKNALLVRIIEKSLDHETRAVLEKYRIVIDNTILISRIQSKYGVNFGVYKPTFTQQLQETLTKSEQNFFKKLDNDMEEYLLSDREDLWEFFDIYMKNHFNQFIELREKLEIIDLKIQMDAKDKH